MRRTIGITLLALCGIASIVLLALGQLGSELGRETASGDTPLGSWHVTSVDYDTNWWALIPLAACFVIGLLCLVLPRRR
jgi:hypothetical protein